MRKFFKVCIIVLVLASLAGGCSSWRETTMRITEAQLQERISKKFPLTKSHQLLGTITYENPQITLRREDNRVEFGLEVSVGNITVNGAALRCSAVMLASVVYKPKKKALFLTDPLLQQFVLNGAQQQDAQALSELFMPAIEKLLKRKPVYRLKDQEGFEKIASMLVKDIRVRKGCIEIVWGI